MGSASRTRARLASEDTGLSFIEILVAIVIMSIVATASATLAITGLAASATQDRRQIAVTIASSTMETIGVTPISGLFTSRAAAAVQAGWTANSSVPGVSQTYPVWDATAGSPAVPVGPTTVPQAGTDFTVWTVIGVCFQPLAGGDCTAPGATATSGVPAVPASATKVIRAIVIVKWTAGRSCPAACSYVTSTLIDPNTDLNWISHD